MGESKTSAAPRRKRRSRQQRLAEKSIATTRRLIRERAAEKQQARLRVQPMAVRSEAPVTAAARVGEKLEREQVWAPDKSIVTVSYRGYSFRGLPENLVRAAGRFAEDVEAAYIALSSKDFEPGVDGGGAHGTHLRCIDAQGRVREVARVLGRRDFEILFAIVVIGAGPSELHKLGAPDHATVSEDIKRILRNLAEFYSGKPQKADRTLLAASRIIQAALEDREPADADRSAIDWVFERQS